MKTHEEVLKEWGLDNVAFSLGDSGPTWDLDSLPDGYYEFDLDELGNPKPFWTEQGESFMKFARNFMKQEVYYVR